MREKYLIAVDLDGTLLRDFDNYDKVSFDCLKKLAKTNIVVIDTGRPFRSSKYYYDLLELQTPIINYNGALIHNPKDPSFPKKIITIDRQVVIDLIRDNEDSLINVFCEIEDEIFLWKSMEEIVPYLHIDGSVLKTGSLSEILYGNPNGAIALSVEGTEDRIFDYFKNKYQGRINVRFWNAQGMVLSEIYSPLTSKGQALKMIAEYYNIPRERVIAIGDGHNDIDMLEYAHVGVAMEDAHPDLLKVANKVTDKVENHGVARFLQSFFK